MPRSPSTKGATRTVFSYLTFASFLALIWAITWRVLVSAPETKGADGKILSLPDRAAIVFGAATIALIFVSFVIGTIAIFEWQKLENTIQRAVGDTVENRVAALEALMKGRTLSLLGYALGEMSTRPNEFHPTDKGVLSEAIVLCKNGYDLLKVSGQRGPMLMGLNNLVYYSCVYREPSKGAYLLQQARLLRDAGSELGIPAYLLTYCRAVVSYSTDSSEWQEAHQLAGSLLGSTLTDNQEREARFYLISLEQPPGHTG
jgi:hypothetical protein